MTVHKFPAASSPRSGSTDRARLHLVGASAPAPFPRMEAFDADRLDNRVRLAFDADFVDSNGVAYRRGRYLDHDSNLCADLHSAWKHVTLGDIFIGAALVASPLWLTWLTFGTALIMGSP